MHSLACTIVRCSPAAALPPSGRCIHFSHPTVALSCSRLPVSAIKPLGRAAVCGSLRRAPWPWPLFWMP
uniref:Putative secreted protein n=1 Tax=Anopheles darlingi TaxID=43151 RepID=A0A2M4D1Z8_ANODA